MNYKIPFIRPCYTRFYKAHRKEIDLAEQSCHKRGDYMLRSDTWKLEKNIAKFVGTKYCASVGSGTDALFLSLLALGIGKGDEVITVSNTFIATIQAIVHTGATPILIDVGEDEQMDVSQVEGAITERTKAIIPVHYTGAMVDMDGLVRIAGEHGLYIVEDACQALGATQNGKKAGSIGTLGCFSFNNAKLLGGKEDGGAVTTNSRELYEKICLLRNHWNVHQLSVDRNDYPQPKEMQWAWKSRLGNANAAFLNVKFKYLLWILKRREEIAERYLKELWHMPTFYVDNYGYELPHNEKGRIWQEFHLRIKDRDKFTKHMQKWGVETLTRDTVPNHKMPGLNLEHFNLPVTEKLAREVTRIPLHEWMTDAEVKYVIHAVKEFFNK